MNNTNNACAGACSFTPEAPSEKPSDITTNAAKVIWAERTGVRTFLGHNSRGASVRIGNGDGEFTPGELLKLALGTCSAMSVDAAIGRVVGEEFKSVCSIRADYNENENRFTDMQTEIIVTSNTQIAENELTAQAYRAIDKHCTIGKTLQAGSNCRVDFVIDERN